MAATVLIVEDDEAIGAGLERVLESQGYVVRRAATGREALRDLSGEVGMVILDLGLPDMDGIEVCRRMRAAAPATPILILTARAEEIDVVTGLDAGADDYLVKPFRLSELLARVRALTRRVQPRSTPTRLRVGTLEVDVASRRAWREGHEIALRPKEFDVLALLAAEAGRVVTRERLMSDVWDTEWMGSTKTLDMHIHALRQKVGHATITTLRGVGYRLETE